MMNFVRKARPRSLTITLPGVILLQRYSPLRENRTRQQPETSTAYAEMEELTLNEQSYCICVVRVPRRTPRFQDRRSEAARSNLAKRNTGSLSI